MNDSPSYPTNNTDATSAPAMRDELQAAVSSASPQTPAQFGAQLFQKKWGHDIDPRTALLVTLDYDYRGHSAQDGVHQGQVASSQTLLQALLDNYQTVGDGRFAETAFGLYTPPDIGPCVRIVEHVDEFADHGSGNHRTYEGVYRRSVPQTYEPLTQIPLRPADFKKWVWTLELKELYQAYLERVWPSDATILARPAYPLRTSVKAAFVMSAWLQRHENSLSEKGLELVLRVAGLPPKQSWSTLTLQQLQAPTRVPGSIKAGRFELYRYTAMDIWTFRECKGSRILLYIPGNSSPWHEFFGAAKLQRWVVEQGKVDDTKHALANHFAEDDRTDGTFHAGVLTALDGMVRYPKIHWLTKTAGFFNNDGYWDPAEYIGFERASRATDPFAQLVLSMKHAAQNSADSIRDDAQVNRSNLNAFVEPLVGWINRFGPLALFVPGGEGLLALAGLIDAGYGLNQVVNGETSTERSQGLTRTVFGLLNALPIVAGAAQVGEGAEAPGLIEKGLEPVDTTKEQGPAPDPHPVAPPEPVPVATESRAELLRGIGASVEGFSDETLMQIGKVSAVDEDMLRLMNTGRTPTPMLADTISRFRIDHNLGPLAGPERSALFHSRYQALQASDNAWVRLFQQQYPGLPKSAVEQMLDRYGVDLASTPEAVEAKRLFSRLDGKARQYQQHVRLNRAFEGLYLRSVNNPESETLALHSLPHLPGWPRGLRIEVLDGSLNGRVLDRCGSLQATDVRRLIKTADHRYATPDASTATDFHEALFSVLSDSERTALQLPLKDSVEAFTRSISEGALSRSELMTGLNRMDSGLPFEAQGLHGGGFPTTPQGAALSAVAMRLQVSDLYPDFSHAQIDEWLLRAGDYAQAHLDTLRFQFEQLCTDLTSYIDRTLQDADDMDIDFLALGDAEAAGMGPAQVMQHNVELLQHAIEYERKTREELADELVLLWQKRPPVANRVYSGEALVGYKLDMDFEEFHRLPVMNVRFDDVIELSMRGFHLLERETLNGFLESFPRLRILSLESIDLRLPDNTGALESVLPPVIPRMSQLTTLNLKNTQLRLGESNAAQLCDLINLQSLDLSENPLGVSPVLLGMNELRQVNLRKTGISTCPIGIREEPYLTSLDLRDNRITRVPPAVINQAIATGRVKLWGNPLTDEDTLQRLITHRQQTGINLWLREAGDDSGEAIVWLRNMEQQEQEARLAIWERLTNKPSGARFLGVMEGLSLTPDYLVSYPQLQARVWQLLNQADASQEFWNSLSHDIEVAGDDADNPMAIFMVLENRARLYRDWVALGRSFPIEAK
ncbi:dermonecrotic toxin domain-containing protein [Pseudomonas sp. LT1P18]|uniref:dermonecrotic toxin domain-containing protein n=1 Tax=Pseudomonas arabinosi TaxID=3398357 RepID=UPI0039F13DA9